MKPRHVAALVFSCAAVAALALLFGKKSADHSDEGAASANAAVTRAANDVAGPHIVAHTGKDSPSSTRPVTGSQKAFEESRIPAVAALSIDRQGSPREFLATSGSPERAARDAQLAALSSRSRAWLASLRDKRAGATDADERARLDADIATLERNLAERGAIAARTVHDERRPFSERVR